MQINEAKEIARAFIESYNKTDPRPDEYIYVFKDEAQDFMTHWFFPFGTKIKEGARVKKNELVIVGGAPGYVICKLTGEVNVIGWGTLSRIEKKLERFKALNNILLSSEETFNLKEFRILTGLPPKLLMKLKDKYKEVSMNDEQNRITIINEIESEISKLPPW